MVATWLGNTPDIARKHYLQITEEHYQRALESVPPDDPAAPAVQRACSALQNPVQSGAVKAGKDPHKTRENAGKCGISALPTWVKADGEGFELPSKTPGNQGFPNESGAESGALDAENGPKDPELGAIIDAWPTLPDALKAGILAMIRAAGKGE